MGIRKTYMEIHSRLDIGSSISDVSKLLCHQNLRFGEHYHKYPILPPVLHYQPFKEFFDHWEFSEKYKKAVLSSPYREDTGDERESP